MRLSPDEKSWGSEPRMARLAAGAPDSGGRQVVMWEGPGRPCPTHFAFPKHSLIRRAHARQRSPEVVVVAQGYGPIISALRGENSS
jgi:hypothetical protein